MTYCPDCKYQFEKGVTECPDCNTKLIDHLPSEHEVDSKWKLLKKFSSEVEANMVKEVMENNDILCLITFDVLHDSLLVDSSATSLFIPESKNKLASELLEELTIEKLQEQRASDLNGMNHNRPPPGTI